MYAISYDEVDGILTATLGGLLSPDEAQGFAQELRLKADQARQKSGRLLMLTDASGLMPY